MAGDSPALVQPVSSEEGPVRRDGITGCKVGFFMTRKWAKITSVSRPFPAFGVFKTLSKSTEHLFFRAAL